jgi:hypothetical protein
MRPMAAKDKTSIRRFNGDDITLFINRRAVKRLHRDFWNLTFFSFGATAPIWALAYLHETLRFTSVF